MGFKISWIAFAGQSTADVLAKIGGLDTAEVDEANESPFSGARIPGDWYVLFSNDFGFVSEERLETLSAQCNLLACQVHEGIMYSAAYGYCEGRLVWSVAHDSSAGIYDLSVTGTPPEIFAAIRERLTEEQNSNGGERASVDYIFDIPVETIAALCNYRHDHWKFEWGKPQFTRIDVPRDQA